MGSSSTFITLFFSLAVLLSTNIVQITASDTDNNKFIENTCSTTSYPSLCYKTLSPYSSSVKTNPWKLCNAALSATIDAAKTTSAAISQLSQQKGLTKREAAVTKDCAENIEDSIVELKQSTKALSKLKGNRNERQKRFQVDSIKTWLSAAVTDEYTCTDGFSGNKLGEEVKQKIKDAISELAKVNSVTLSIFNHLPY